MNKLEKLFKEIIPFKTTKEYFDYFALSYSRIKDIYYNPKSFSDKKQKITSFMSLGSAVDQLVQPDEKDDFIIIPSIPADNYLSMISYIEENTDVDDLEEITDQITENAYKHVESKANWKIETKKEKLIKTGNEYFKALKKSKKDNTIVLTPELHDKALQITLTLKTHPLTKHLFNPINDDRFSIFYQYPILFQVNGLEYKSLLDVLVLDHTQKTITIYDLKVGSTSFMKSFFKFKWYYQAALYDYALEELLDSDPLKDIIKTEHYFVNPFKFIYMHTEFTNVPYIYKLQEDFIILLRYTGIQDGFNYIPSLEEICSAAAYYVEQLEGNNNIDVSTILPFELYKHKGEIPIDYKTQGNLVY